MGIVEAIGLFLLKNWKLVLIGLFVGWIGWLYWDNGHLQHKVQDLTLEIANVRAQNETMANSSAAITRKYESSLKNKWDAEDRLSAANQERVKNAKILASISISNAAYSVLHGTNGTTKPQVAAGAKQGNDAASTTSSVVLDPNAPSGKTMADLYGVYLENFNRVNKNADQVEEWQKFWIDYKNAVIDAVTPRAK